MQADDMDETGTLAKAMRDAERLREAEHPSGGTCRQAYTMGRCHVMAIALQRRIGGELVVLTEELDPTSLMHVGVLLPDGRVADVEGAMESRTWHAMWAEDSQIGARRTSVAELQEMMAHRPVTEREIAIAGPLADALAGAIGPTPPGPIRTIDFSPARTFDVPGVIPEDVVPPAQAKPSRSLGGAMHAWALRGGPGF